MSLNDTPLAMVPIVQRNARESPLLRLPTELRNKIFEDALGGITVQLRRSWKLQSKDPLQVRTCWVRPLRQTDRCINTCTSSKAFSGTLSILGATSALPRTASTGNMPFSYLWCVGNSIWKSRP
jgi:hypothetical protein